MSDMYSKLALFGGKPVNRKPFPAANTIGPREIKEAVRVLKSGLLSGYLGKYGEKFLGGPMVRRAEKAFADFFKVRFAVSVNSATSGLHAAVASLGIGPGDEVIVSPYTMTASASAILMNNAVPVFADIESDIFCLDPKKIEAAVTPRTKAIMVVHLFGHPAPMDEIMGIAKRHRLKVIEDAAQAPASLYKGRFSATIGDVGVFSLNYHKAIHTGEGGIVVTNDRDAALALQLVRNHGEAVIDDIPSFEAKSGVLGWNYRLCEVEAAMARSQLKRLNSLNARRITLASYLTQRIARFNAITPPKILKGARHVYYLYAMKFNQRQAGIPRNLFVKALAAEGVPITAGYMKPLYLQSVYQRKNAYGKHNCPFLCNYYKWQREYKKGLCPVVERLEEKEVMTTNICRIPLTHKEIDIFVSAVEKVFDNIDALKRYGHKT